MIFGVGGILKFFSIQKPFEYEIENDLMFLTIFDKYSNEKVGVAVYHRADNKIYTLKDISHIDNLDIPFENDENPGTIRPNCTDSPEGDCD